jgi:hypothetical protein
MNDAAPLINDSSPKTKSPYSLRLTFSYEGSTVSLIAKDRIKMLALPSHQVSSEGGQSGFWYEVRDDKGQTIYRRITQNPIQFETEIRSDDPKKPLNWHGVDKPKGMFVFHIPDLPSAKTVVFMSSPMEPKRRQEPAQELTSFELNSDRKEQANG